MKKNFIYYLMPSVVIGVLSIFMIPITTYYLDPKDFGVFSILTALTMPIGPLASTGVTWVLPANYFKIDEDEKKILVFNLLVLDLILKLLWVSVFWLLAPAFLPILIKDYELSYGLYFKLILITIPITTFWPTVSCLIVMQKKGSVHAALEILQWGSGAIIILICLTVFKLKTIALFLSPLLSGVVCAVFILGYVRKFIKPKLTKRWLIEIFKVGIPSIPANLFEILTNISDRYFIQRWVNLSKLGIYSHSQSYKRIFNIGIKGFSRTFGPASLEIYSNNMNEDKLQSMLHRWYGLVILAGSFITFFSYEIINILTHGKFIEAANLVPIWFFLIIFSTYGYPYTQFLIVNKKNVFMMYSQIVVGLIFILITAVLIYWFGLIGATLGIVLSNLAIQLLCRWYARSLGCKSIGEKGFAITMVIMTSIYLLMQITSFNMWYKAIIYVIMSGWIIYYFDIRGEVNKIIVWLQQRKI